MTARALLSIDTDPHPALPVYSAGNFGEVAPERLSIMAWSLIGDPVERGCRALARRLWPRSTWHTGSHYVFVGYFACRPYHNLSAYCHMGREVPGLTGEDVASAYFEDATPPPALPGLGAGPLRRSAAPLRMLREFASLRGRVVQVEGRVAELEDEARAALGGRRPVALGAAYRNARAVLDEVWELHYSTTQVLVPLRALQRAIGERTVGYWDELEPWLNRPNELVWSSLHDAAAEGIELGPGEFLDRAFYEVADRHEPWSGYAARHRAQQAAQEPRPPAFDALDVAWGMVPRARLALLPQVAHVVGDTMACREASKSLAMRCLHVFRRLLPRVAEAVGVDDADWPYVTVGELVDEEPELLAERAARRRQECRRALAEPMPDVLVPGPGRPGAPAPAAPSAPPARRGRGVSPGVARGVVVAPGQPELPDEGGRILVCDSADADVQPLLPLVDGVITARGSVLSHVAILVREYGIPAVVGHSLAGELRPGQQVTLDGTTGEVSIVAD